jgi:hypothetical protein
MTVTVASLGGPSRREPVDTRGVTTVTIMTVKYMVFLSGVRLHKLVKALANGSGGSSTSTPSPRSPATTGSPPSAPRSRPRSSPVRRVVMVAGIDEVLNPGPVADHPVRVPVEVDVEVVESWGGG